MKALYGIAAVALYFVVVGVGPVAAVDVRGDGEPKGAQAAAVERKKGLEQDADGDFVTLRALAQVPSGAVAGLLEDGVDGRGHGVGQGAAPLHAVVVADAVEYGEVASQGADKAARESGHEAIEGHGLPTWAKLSLLAVGIAVEYVTFFFLSLWVNPSYRKTKYELGRIDARLKWLMDPANDGKNSDCMMSHTGGHL